MDKGEEINMESSGLLNSEWDIVNSSSSGNVEDLEDEPHDSLVIDRPINATEKDIQKGSCVDDIFQEQDCNTHWESNSSSDIDIIDESALDESQINPLIPSIEFSLSSSLDQKNICESEKNLSESIVPESEPVPEPTRNNTFRMLSHLTIPQLKHFSAVLVIGVLLGTFVLISDLPHNEMKEMEKRVITLQAENIELKNHMLSKMEDDKLFVVLEEQISVLKDENSKLSSSMQDLIRQLEEQTTIFKKENEIREKEPYKSEIDVLKEQVNNLRIDNEELQKQLVRMRYGIYSPHSQQSQTPHPTGDKKESKDKISTDKNENSTEVLSEEVKELRSKLYSEVEKLKNWKESVQHLMQKLENHQQHPEDFVHEKEEQGSFERAKSKTEDDRKFKSKKSNKKEKGYYESILKDFNKNLIDVMNNIPHINVTDLINRYANVNKKKVKSVIESVGQFFKKAQEKTREIFDDDVKNDMWNFMGGLRKKWNEMKKGYFSKGHKKAQPPTNNQEAHQTEKFHKSEMSHKKHENSRHRNNPEVAAKEKQTVDPSEPLSPSASEQEDDSGWQSHVLEMDETGETDTTESWLFERAASRSELREKEDDVNWYLRNRKEDDVYESDDLE